MTVEPVVDVFNLFNSENLRRPEVTNLIFNFDGTVQSGVGDPRQMQLGAPRDLVVHLSGATGSQPVESPSLRSIIPR